MAYHQEGYGYGGYGPPPAYHEMPQASPFPPAGCIPPEADSLPPLLNPALPVIHPLPRLQDGHMIRIQGFIPKSANQFHINLSAGGALNGQVDSALHLKASLGSGVAPFLERNSFLGGQWGTPEVWGPPSPLMIGADYELIILFTTMQFRIAINGVHFCEFSYRTSLEIINHVVIEGDAMIRSLTIQNPVNPSAPPPQPAMPPPQPVMPPPMPAVCPPRTHYTPPPQPVTPNLMPMPYHCMIPGGMSPGRMITVSGKILPNAEKFRIDLCYRNDKERDVAFRFKPRFKNRLDVLRNTRNGPSWGREETCLPGFMPLVPGQTFQIIILCEKDKYKVTVNGAPFIEYQHRLRNLRMIKHLLIAGHIQLYDIRA